MKLFMTRLLICGTLAMAMPLCGCSGKKGPATTDPETHGPQGAGASSFGRFEGELLLQPTAVSGQWKVLKDYSFIDREDKRWHVAAETLVNRDAIPKPFLSLVSSPFDGGHSRATLLCFQAHRMSGFETWPVGVDRAACRMFYEACRCDGIDKRQAKLYYWAIWNGRPGKMLKIVKETRQRTIVKGDHQRTEEYTVQVPVYKDGVGGVVGALSKDQQEAARNFFMLNDLELEEIADLAPEAVLGSGFRPATAPVPVAAPAPLPVPAPRAPLPEPAPLPAPAPRGSLTAPAPQPVPAPQAPGQTSHTERD